jgi:two-component system, cell cycle response regulator
VSAARLRAIAVWWLLLPALALAQPGRELVQRLDGLQGAERLRVLVELTTALRQEAPAEAIAYGKEALDLLEAHPDALAKVSVLNELGWAYMVQGNNAEAVAHAEQGRALAEQVQDGPGLARAYNNLGVMARSRGEPVAAIALFERALSLQRRHGMRREEAGSLNNLGVAHGFDLADYGTALDYHLQALEVRRGLGDQQDLALSYNNIGVIYARLGEFDRAVEHYQQALQIRRALGVKSRTAGTLHNLGDLYIDRREWEAALPYHEEALALREETGDRQGRLLSLIALGRVHGELGQPEQAAALLGDALALAAQLGARRELGLALLAKAELERRRGRLADAEADARAALAAAEAIKAPESQRQVWLELSLIHEAAGNPAAALQAFREHKAVSDRIFDQDRSRRLELLESRYQAERREHEIEALRAERAEQALQSGQRRFQRDALAALLLGAALLAIVLHRRRKDLERANRKLAELSYSDALTGLKNRRYLRQLMEGDAAVSQRRQARADDAAKPSGTDIVFLLLDLDHFKQINDRHGHAAGDRALEQFAGVLRATCRSADTLVRWGGEEFLVVNRFVDRDDAMRLAERLRRAIEEHAFDIGGGKLLRLTCSIGFAAYPLCPQRPESTDWEPVLALADDALYAAKRGGRNAWVGVLEVPVAVLPAAGAPRLELTTLAGGAEARIASSLDASRLREALLAAGGETAGERTAPPARLGPPVLGS